MFVIKSRNIKKALNYLVIALTLLLMISTYYPVKDKEAFKQSLAYPDSQYVAVNGVDVHYRTLGEGPDLVLLHGNGGNIHHFDLMVEALSQHYKVTVLDYLGHGLTGADPKLDYSNENFMRFFESFFDALNVKQAHIAGNSFGGYLGMQYAQLHPERVNKIVLLGAYGGLCETVDYSGGHGFVPEDYAVIRFLSQYFYPFAVVKSVMQGFVYDKNTITDEMVHQARDGYSIKGNRTYRAEIIKFDHPREIISREKLPHPALLIYGEQDQIHTICEAKNLASRINSQGLVVLKETGHLPMMENPKGVGEAMLEFLAEPFIAEANSTI